MDWVERLNRAIAYIDNNLDGDIRYEEISRITASPIALFQRFFVLMTGITLMEYIRRRKLTCALTDLQTSNEKVIDIAVKYGYDSADAFCVAFKRLYGLTPTQARKTHRKLQRYDRLLFTLSISYVKGEPHMIEIQNVHLEQMPPLRFIGKRYTNADRDAGGGYGARWGEWFARDWFTPLSGGESAWFAPPVPGVEPGCIGFMRWNCRDFDTSFEYWIGLMCSPDTPVPEGYESIDLPAATVGVCWLNGREKDGLYGQHERCWEALQAEGLTEHHDAQGYGYAFERYNGERFEKHYEDENSRVILDYGIYGKEQVNQVHQGV